MNNSTQFLHQNGAPLWKRRPGEGARAHAALMRYLEMGPQRSHAKVAQEYGIRTELVNRWSRQHKWVLRAHRYNAMMASRRVAKGR